MKLTPKFLAGAALLVVGLALAMYAVMELPRVSPLLAGLTILALVAGTLSIGTTETGRTA